MNADQINAKIYAGRGKVALRLGSSNVVYRPFKASNPLTNPIATISASFNSGDNKYAMPNMPGDPIWFGDFDARITQAGDYLVRSSDATNIKYIASQQPLLPIIVIECNRSIMLSRSNINTGISEPTKIGAMPYVGVSVLLSVDVFGTSAASGGFIGWPCSIIQGKGGSRVQGALPTSSLSLFGWSIMLPSSIPEIIRAGDVLTDDLNRNYSVSGAELTDIGWRIAAVEIHQ